MSTYEYDVLILGAGIAGLTCALKLADHGVKVGIVSRESGFQHGNTYWAQGGIVHLAPSDKTFIDDVMKASSGTSNLEAVKVLYERSGPILSEILINKAKTPFAKNGQGELEKTLEAAHSEPRILFQGDFTGKIIAESLCHLLKDRNQYPNVQWIHQHTAIDLITPPHHGLYMQQRYEDNRILGAYLFNQQSGEVVKALSKMTVLATGGIGALYLHHSNSSGQRGDGHAMAKRAGAFMNNMEFIQFHPTTFYDRSSHRRFLISEAVRGEGGRLINSNGERFMKKYHPDGELAPRDVVSRAIIDEMISTGHSCVYLDISHKEKDWLESRFPTIFQMCVDKHIDISKQPIPVVPAAHYTCGGIKVDLNGRTNLKQLYAVGEVACNGVHGANRLASTSLMEGMTFGYVAAEDILKKYRDFEVYDTQKIRNWINGQVDYDSSLVAQDWLTVKQTMWNYVGLTRSTNRLLRARAMFNRLYEEVSRFYYNSELHDELIGLRNGIEVALMVVNSSIINKESIGCFYRSKS